MLKIGLTGSIGMGKSTIGAMFAKLGINIICADEIVHKLYKKNGAANIQISQIYEDVLDNNGDIDRQKLSVVILKAPEALKKIEEIVHPLVKKTREDMLWQFKEKGAPYVILDIPLLFETNSQKEFDKIIVVDCDYETQKARVLARPKMTEAKFKAILAKQMPNSQKVALADFIIDTSQSLETCQNRVIEIDEELRRLSKNA